MTKVVDLIKTKKKKLTVPGTQMKKNGRDVHMMHISPNWMKDNATGGRK